MVVVSTMFLVEQMPLACGLQCLSRPCGTRVVLKEAGMKSHLEGVGCGALREHLVYTGLLYSSILISGAR